MPEPVSLLNHLRTLGYHPRSSKHGDAMVQAVVEDLVVHCPRIASDAASGQLVYRINHVLQIGTDSWKTDLAIGTPPHSGIPAAANRIAGMPEATPVHVRIAVEAKAVMTKHSGARRNRKRDLEAHHDHVHRYRHGTIAAGLTMVNASRTFYSPVPPEGVREHGSDAALGVINVMRGVTQSAGPDIAGLDALGLLVVDMDNVNLPATRYVTRAPAPRPGDPLHWDTFIEDICAAYATRFP
jgi:hypothetical protein